MQPQALAGALQSDEVAQYLTIAVLTLVNVKGMGVHLAEGRVPQASMVLSALKRHFKSGVVFAINSSDRQMQRA